MGKYLAGSTINFTHIRKSYIYVAACNSQSGVLQDMNEESEKPVVKAAAKIINELRLTPEEIEKYEECEIISDLMDEETLKSIDDEVLRKIILQMRTLHLEVRRMNYAAYIEMAKSLFGKIPNRNYVLKYHELEELSKKLNGDEIKKIREENVRDTLLNIKHVHNNIAEKKANVIRRIKMY